MVSFLHGDDGRISHQREVDPRIRHQVGLKLVQIHIEGAIKSQRGRDRRYDLTNQAVEISIGRPLNVQVATADVVDGLIVHHESAVRMIQSSMRGQNRVIRLHHGGSNLRGGVNGELQFGLFAIVNGESFHQ